MADLIEGARRVLPGLELDFDRPPDVDRAQVHGAPELLHKALKTLLELAAAFSKPKRRLHLRAGEAAPDVRFTLAVDALRLSADQVADFFKIESVVRSKSAAEKLGLGPVVAQRIIAAFGGTVTLSKDGDTNGELVIVLVGLPSAKAGGPSRAG